MRISVVIATLNRQEALCDTLSSVLCQDYPDFEVVVVDQTASMNERLRRLLVEAPPLLRYIRLQRTGAAVARNAGLQKATGDIVVFVDDDVIVDKFFLTAHARNYADPSVDGVTGLIMERGGSTADGLAELMSLGAAPGLRLGDVCDVVWAPTGNLSVRASAFSRSGYFDERLPGNYSEDLDFTLRLRHAGCRLIADTRVQLIHLALGGGGCEMRNPSMRETKDREMFRCVAYCRLKHLRCCGLALIGKCLFRDYRRYALNRTSLANGSAWKRHLIAVRELFGVIRLLARRPT